MLLFYLGYLSILHVSRGCQRLVEQNNLICPPFILLIIEKCNDYLGGCRRGVIIIIMRRLSSPFSSFCSTYQRASLSLPLKLASPLCFSRRTIDMPNSTKSSTYADFKYRWIDGAERLERYQPGGYHPVLIGDVLEKRYRVVHKLGYGTYSTIWIGVRCATGRVRGC